MRNTIAEREKLVKRLRAALKKTSVLDIAVYWGKALSRPKRYRLLDRFGRMTYRHVGERSYCTSCFALFSQSIESTVEKMLAYDAQFESRTPAVYVIRNADCKKLFQVRVTE